MATEKQAQYLKTLIERESANLHTVGLGPTDGLRYSETKYGDYTAEQADELDRTGEFDRMDSELLSALKSYIANLNPQSLNTNECSRLIDGLKSRRYVAWIIKQLLA